MARYHERKSGVSLDPYVFNKAVEYLAKFIGSKYMINDNNYSSSCMADFIAMCITERELKTIAEKSKCKIATEGRKPVFKNLFETCLRIEAGNDAFVDFAHNISKLLLSKVPVVSGFELDESVFKKKMVDLVETFDLNRVEEELISLIYIFESCERFKRVLYDFENPQGIVRILKVIYENDEAALAIIPRAIEKVKKIGIIDSYFNLQDYIKEYFGGVSENPLSSDFYSISSRETLPIEYFDAMKEDMEVLEDIIANKEHDEGVNILFYGFPGTGKSEFARCLAKSLNRTLLEINNSEEGCTEDKNSKFFRFLAYRACMNRANPDNSIILLDEADEMINGSSGFFLREISNPAKNIINTLLDESRHVSIWITNKYADIDESTKRRFNYSIEFRRFTKGARVKIWKNTLKKHKIENILSDDEIRYLSEKYETNAGNINIAVSNFRKIRLNAKKSSLETLESIFNSHLRIMDIKVNSVSRDTKYSLEGLNIRSSSNLERVLKTVKDFSNSIDAKSADSIKNMNILLYGPSGTGKTEFAKHLASVLDKDLLVKRGSDLLDMYVGGTEKNIRDAFRQAEAEKAILFIDEFEGLIGARETALRRWEVSQVN